MTPQDFRLEYSYMVGGLLATVSPQEEQDKLNLCAKAGWEMFLTSMRKIDGTEYIIHYFRRPVYDAKTGSRFDPKVFGFAA